MVAASVRGTAHVRTGAPCQDAHAFTLLAGGTLLAAVADGLGSVALADVGARRAAEVAVAAMRTAIGAPLRRPRRAAKRPAISAHVIRAAFTAARWALEVEARARRVPLSALATTLLAVVVAPGGTASVGQLGDGVIVTGARDGTLRRPVAPADTGAANVVTPLTHPDALSAVRVATLVDVDAVVVCTDGLELFVADGLAGTPYEPFLGPALRFAAASEDPACASGQLAEWLTSSHSPAGTDDDCTLLLAVRRRTRHARPDGAPTARRASH